MLCLYFLGVEHTNAIQQSEMNKPYLNIYLKFNAFNRWVTTYEMTEACADHFAKTFPLAK